MELSVLILQIITILISVSSLVLNLMITTHENNKQQYVKVVTAQRLNNKEIVRDNVKVLISSSNACARKLLDDQVLKQCITSEAAIETVLKSIYQEDNAVLSAAHKLVKALSEYLNGNGSSDSIESARHNLLNEFSVYDLSDWRFIKKQAHGNSYGSTEFDKIYESTRKEFFIKDDTKR